jgi:YHS domain-containing protein
MKQFLTIIFILLSSSKIFACECPEYNLKELDTESYEWSDIVLIGNISNTGTKYQIEIKESLKGKITDNTIQGLIISKSEVFNTCTFYPRKKGEYLFYLKIIVIDGKTYYYSSECLGSRLLNFENQPVSLLTNKTKEELIKETEIWIEELRKSKNNDFPTKNKRH